MKFWKIINKKIDIKKMDKIASNKNSRLRLRIGNPLPVINNNSTKIEDKFVGMRGSSLKKIKITDIFI